MSNVLELEPEDPYKVETHLSYREVDGKRVYYVDPKLTEKQKIARDACIKRISKLYLVKHEKYNRPTEFIVTPYFKKFLDYIFCGKKRIAVMKSRQVYMTTGNVNLMFDFCIHQPNFVCAIHNMNEKDGTRTMEDKLHYTAQNSPFVKDHLQLQNAITKEGVRFKNGSKIIVERSGRSHTAQFNLITEAAYTAEIDPAKFKEVLQGALNGSQYYLNIFETSPFGGDNEFTRICKRGWKLEKDGELHDQDIATYFIGWHQKANNVAPDQAVKVTKISNEFEEYFLKIEKELGIELTIHQKVWYISKFRNESHENWLTQMSEHPSTIEEAMESNQSLYILRHEMNLADKEGRIAELPFRSDLPAVAFWDFGGGKSHTAVILVQKKDLFSDYYSVVWSYQSKDDNLQRMLNSVNNSGYNVVHHFLPHDARQTGATAKHLGGDYDLSLERIFNSQGIRNLTIIERVSNKRAGFVASQSSAGRFNFCSARAKELIHSLNYVQKEFDEKNEIVLDQLRRNGAAAENNHLYDCFELACRALQGLRLTMFLDDYNSGFYQANYNKVRNKGDGVIF